MGCKCSKFLLISILTFAVGFGVVQVWQDFLFSREVSINSVHPIEVQASDNPQAKCMDFDDVKSLGFVNMRNLNRIYSLYPKEAIEQKIHGDVVIEVLVDEKGLVQCTRNVSGHPILAKSVEISVHQLRFSPYNQKGKNIRYRGLYVENFIK